MTYVPAQIVNVTTGQIIPCYFRPEKYTFAKTNTFTEGKAVGKTFQPPHFKGGGPITLALDLVFDTYEKPPGGRDVRQLTDGIWDMMKVTPKKKEPITNKSEPPHVEFRWGDTWSFTAVIKTISQAFTLFDADGTPVRSTMHIEFTQALEAGHYPGQNPTSGGHQGYAVHTVTEGETIDWIAFREYGNSNAWRHLATVNHLDDPGRLQPGQRLVLVPLEV